MVKEKIAVHKTKDLGAEARRLIEKLLGRRLRAEEEVAILAFPPHPSRSQSARQAAMKRMEAFLDEAASHAAEFPEDELESAIDEAIHHVRRRKN